MKHLKSFNEDNSNIEDHLEKIYGKSVMDEYRELIGDIKDRTYDLIDLGFEISIVWAYSTRMIHSKDRTPKLELFITGEDELFDQNYEQTVKPCIEVIRGLISECGFSSGGGFVNNASGYYKINYKILIQK
jgi:hypothetical protein